jgi:hypothetical protein
MVFSPYLFLFYFLPLALVLYYTARRRTATNPLGNAAGGATCVKDSRLHTPVQGAIGPALMSFGNFMRYMSVAAFTATIIVFTSTAEAQTGWTGTVTTISSPIVTNGFLAAPKVAFETDGDGWAVWSQIGGNPSNVSIQAARYEAASGIWGPPITLAGPGLDRIHPRRALRRKESCAERYHRQERCSSYCVVLVISAASILGSARALSHSSSSGFTVAPAATRRATTS